jgi:hypothetical protein
LGYDITGLGKNKGKELVPQILIEVEVDKMDQHFF